MRETALVVALLLAVAVGVPTTAAHRCLARNTLQRPTFTSGTEAVRIDVLVSENGRPVTGLGPGDFEVRDNGQPQHVSLVSFDNVPLSLILVVDASESVAGQRLRELQGAARSLLARLLPDDRAGLVTFNAAVVRHGDVTGDRPRVEAAVAGVQPASGTALVDAVYASLFLGSPDPSRVLLLVFSDGLDVSSWLSPAAVVGAGRQADAVVYAVTVGAEAVPSLAEPAKYERATKRALDSGKFLRDLADATGGAVLDVDSTRDLNGAFDRILAEFRQRYLISYVPRGPARAGWHEVEVRIKGRPRATVKARSGYQAR